MLDLGFQPKCDSKSILFYLILHYAIYIVFYPTENWMHAGSLIICRIFPIYISVLKIKAYCVLRKMMIWLLPNKIFGEGKNSLKIFYLRFLFSSFSPPFFSFSYFFPLLSSSFSSTSYSSHFLSPSLWLSFCLVLLF